MPKVTLSQSTAMKTVIEFIRHGPVPYSNHGQEPESFLLDLAKHYGASLHLDTPLRRQAAPAPLPRHHQGGDRNHRGDAG